MNNSPPPLRYSHRAKPFSSELELELTGRELIAAKGRSRQVFPLAAIERIRLEYSPRNVARLVFRCSVRATDGRSVTFDNLNWLSLIQTERRDADYKAFVTALAQRATPSARRDAGPVLLRYRLVQIVGWLTITLLLGSAGYFLLRPEGFGTFVSRVYAVIGALFGGYLVIWHLEYLKRNRPRPFTAGAVPAEVLPPEAPPIPQT
ncbi:MAG TPA: hypothetical protein PKW21_09015 [Rhabdaerophilum sp.]|nr:hypothetical protein [Rhabdaerophilum sp.]